MYLSNFFFLFIKQDSDHLLKTTSDWSIKISYTTFEKGKSTMSDEICL